METRIGNIIIGSSGGTAGGTANNYKIALPSSWVRQMGISPDSRQVELSFDGTTITIARKQSLQEFLEAIGVDSYAPLEIIQKTQGRMAEDDLWLTVEEII